MYHCQCKTGVLELTQGSVFKTNVSELIYGGVLRQMYHRQCVETDLSQTVCYDGFVRVGSIQCVKTDVSQTVC